MLKAPGSNIAPYFNYMSKDIFLIYRSKSNNISLAYIYAHAREAQIKPYFIINYKN